MRALLRSRPIFARASQPILRPSIAPDRAPEPPPAVAPAPAAGNLAEYLCGQLADPPRSDFAHREVMEEVELRFGDKSLHGTTTYVGLRTLEVYTKAAIECDELVSVGLCSGLHPWSSGVVTRCVETIGGWRVEVTFPSTASRDN